MTYLERLALVRAEEQMETAARQREPVRGPGARRGRCECGAPATDKERGCDDCARRNAMLHQAERKAARP